MLYIYSTLTGRKSFAGKLAQILDGHATQGPLKGGSDVICWGRSQAPESLGEEPLRWLNHPPPVVRVVSHKIRCFQELEAKGIRTVDWALDQHIAQAWLDGGRSVFERYILTGHSGTGIQLRMPREGMKVEEAPLYTRLVRGGFIEYRVHVVAEEVVCVQQKRKMSEEAVAAHGFILPSPPIRYRIRTYRNGWVFAVNDLAPLSEENQQLAISAMAAVGAGSGCVDMAVTEDGVGHVIEINSAPALRSATVAAAYAAKFANLLGEENQHHG